ncbi:MAG: hypothetical protein Q4B48_06260 [Syntrophomonadaceae bacterium]|nr:hypothetical protein [Syntrophomonadaceae bacterium]
MNKNNLRTAEKALQRMAKGEGKTVAEIRGDIQRALLVGLNSKDPDIRARWRAIPSKGDMPTP